MKIFLNSFFFALLLLPVFTMIALAGPHNGKYFVYIGTYTEDGSKSRGIYVYRYDADTGEIASRGLAAETTNPSWIALHPSGRFLYAVNEVGNYKGPNSGGVSAFAVDHATGKLTFLNEVPSRGADPCYITVDKTGKFVLVANYTGGSVAVFPVLSDGKLGEATAFVQHTGHGTNPKRQEGPHAHSIELSPDNRFAYVNDLGLDELLVYKFDSATGSLTPNDPPFAKLAAGSGPRHFVLRPDGKFAYVISEMGHTVMVFSNDAATGRLQQLQTVTTLPRDFQGRNDDAEIRIHPSGKFLYASNRGDDSIAIYAIDEDKGTLTQLGIVPTGGKEPRSFEIDPTGKLLFAANQKSDNIVVFKIDAKTGRLTPTEKVLDVGSAVCVKFVKAD
ncbi:MAG TPA: lactonase family protein [Terriglobales bacterium]|nr:lactonase family protein [Terriglobales bacterium]